MEQFSNDTCLLAEQIWDGADLPAAHLRCGGPSGSAVPLLWAHSEYIRLLRSCDDGEVFDLIPEVAARYRDRKTQSKVEFWLPKYPIWQIKEDSTLRICAPEPFRIRWSSDKGSTHQDGESHATAVGAEYFDIAPPALRPEVEFTFFWTRRGEWEDHGHLVQVR
jgi:glucoamylase